MNNQDINIEAAAKPRDQFQLSLPLDNEELAAVEAWRASNQIASLSDAVRELVRLGLLSEVAKVHSIVSAVRDSVER